jgi:uncharacterized 2Fe-2S/4Fe-4S cluster protein (DUF4445 family)
MIRIELQPLGRTIEVEPGTLLLEPLDAFGVEFPCGGHGRCGGCRVRVAAGTLPVSDDDAALFTPEEIAEGWRLACAAKPEGTLTLEIGQWETVILADHTSFAFTPRPGLGIAVDLGTTTLVAQLLDLQLGQVLAVRTAVNPQSRFGSDVMNRIQAALDGNKAELVMAVRRGVGELVTGVLASLGVSRDDLAEVVVVGNTVMHHLFCDLDMGPLATAPFETPDRESHRFRSSELGWDLPGEPVVRFLPCLGSFVGSDILAGVIATGMQRRTAPAILVDLGTNGEIVVGNRDRMLFASTAAGPAFEGGRISVGMRATTGAIAEVIAENGRLCCRVIGGVEPRGLCGSGLVDAVATALDLGLILPSGRLADPSRPLELAPPVALTQGDIRQLQLAKGAIAAGVKILRRRFGEEACRAAPIYLAGAFGNYVNRTSARRIGLIDAPEECIQAAGNTALLGAKMALFEDHGEDESFTDLRGRMEHVSLAADPHFQEIFVQETLFPG